MEKARADVEQARAEFDAQVMQAKQAYELFSVQKDAFVEEKARWEQEGMLYATNDCTHGLSSQTPSIVLSRMTSAPLLDDLKYAVSAYAKQHSLMAIPQEQAFFLKVIPLRERRSNAHQSH